MKRASFSPSRALRLGLNANPDPLGSSGSEQSSWQDLRRLYERSILDHSKNPHNRGKLDGVCSNARGYNPLCGDEITVYFNFSAGRLERVSFESSSCAICTASASYMTVACRGRQVAQLHGLVRAMGVIVSPHERIRPRAPDGAAGALSSPGTHGGRGPVVHAWSALPPEQDVGKPASIPPSEQDVGKPASISTPEQCDGNAALIEPAVLEALGAVVGETSLPLDPSLVQLQVFAGLRDYPLRAQCAMLPWQTLVEAVEKA